MTGIYRHPLHSRKEEHKLLRDKLEQHLTDLDEGEVFEAGKTKVIYVRDLGYFVFKEREKSKNNGYFKSISDIPEFGYYWIRTYPHEALSLIPLKHLKQAAEYYEI